ncbi:MAG: hypothetical protein A3C07_00410 [Candidatus Sungbacteria bacterium RIFCSPHIGHO2_02_FULL_47_11]|uniref:Methyltransferase domain-containing protein n=1 Tax=Candidatus Sungbacteria bacterium RIFCSPHIGHO2_02_FULL_47_11 TaxID=1802270 RepID=A0A1G2KKD3_9BACT|nr:MAG: hypothetical protein A3C07_00410 [Candidatus Sungbacteria bacterium RIFCSPHIGHO2_02_FULL_47_11]
MTILEKKVFGHPRYWTLGEKPDAEDAQLVPDAITEEVLSSMQPEEVVAHVCEIYNATALEYAANPNNKDIINELIAFMSLLPEGSEVLDLGCAWGRDVFFMAIDDPEFRKSLMGRKSPDGKTTLDKFRVPEKTFRVTAFDNSLEMLKIARGKERELVLKGLFKDAAPPIFTYEDMHNINPWQKFRPFDGVWSCTALFTHTPKKLLRLVMESVARQLKPGGVLFVNYTNGRADGRYDKLLLSGTGRIEYFSQPNPEMIENIAHDYSLWLIREYTSDMRDKVGNLLKKDLFVSQFYRKYN